VTEALVKLLWLKLQWLNGFVCCSFLACCQLPAARKAAPSTCRSGFGLSKGTHLGWNPWKVLQKKCTKRIKMVQVSRNVAMRSNTSLGPPALQEMSAAQPPIFEPSKFSRFNFGMAKFGRSSAEIAAVTLKRKATTRQTSSDWRYRIWLPGEKWLVPPVQWLHVMLWHRAWWKLPKAST